MKKWLFILIFVLSFLLLGAAVSHADGFWNYFSGTSASAVSTSGAYAPCPYTSAIPNYVPQYNPTPAYNPTPVYPGPIYNPTPVYAPSPAYNPPAYPNYPSYQAYQPVNPYHRDYSNLVVSCRRGYQPNASMTACVPVPIPPHAHLSIWGSTYACDPGYNSWGDACVADSYYGQYPY